MITLGRGIQRMCSGLTRRDFLRVGGVGLGSLGLSLTESNARESVAPRDGRAVILLMLVGGPSQLETWDPKPDAVSEIRGPFGSIATRVPGVRISEHLPRLANRMDKLALVRSLHHDAAPIHETGQQLLQTGQLCRTDEEHPHVGSVAAQRLGARTHMPPFVMVPGPIENTGVKVPHGQSAGRLGAAFDPFHRGGRPGLARIRSREGPGPGAAVPGPGRGGWPDVFRRGSAAGLGCGVQCLPPRQRAPAASRRLRAGHLRPELPAGPAAGRGRRSPGHRQHVRYGLQSGDMGLPRCLALQHARGLRDGACCRPSTKRSRRCWTTLPLAACWTRRWWSRPASSAAPRS